MLLRQLKPFTKTWAQPGDGPNNFKVKPKLNKKMNIRFGKEALELADRILMGPGGKKIDEYVLKEALERQKRLCVGFNKDTGEKLYRPALKLSKWRRTEVTTYKTLCLLKVGALEKVKSLSDL